VVFFMDTSHGRRVTFGMYTLDTENGILRKGNGIIHLRPKSFALLMELVRNPGNLVSKDELLKSVWRNCHVGDEALKHCVSEIRRALDDDPEKPEFIETVHRRGYRFIGNADAAPSPEKSIERTHTPAVENNSLFVGREEERSRLSACLEKAIMKGSRQVVFISGDQGIGKTTLVDVFLQSIPAERFQGPRGKTGSRLLIAKGQCVKGHGGEGVDEAYMPFLQAFTDLVRSRDRKLIFPLLRRYAPLWLKQMPSLCSPAQLHRLRQLTEGAARQRMMREMAEAIEALTADTPLVLVLEDLHLSDDPTINLISYLARRRGRARLFLIATCRRDDTSTDEHSLTAMTSTAMTAMTAMINELLEHRQCIELPLPLLDTDAARIYVNRRFPGHRFQEGMAEWIMARTGGNPLLMENVLDHLQTLGCLEQRDRQWVVNISLDEASRIVPPTVLQIIERRLRRCSSAEQRLLLAASLVESEFTAADLAAITGGKAVVTAAVLNGLAQRHLFLQQTGDPASGNGHVPAYRFAHTLYRSVCYRLLPDDMRFRYHKRISGRMETQGSLIPRRSTRPETGVMRG
jgi:predicted ATPase/DNA-binding winged helix-turn-helix (wHTH) protein